MGFGGGGYKYLKEESLHSSSPLQKHNKRIKNGAECSGGVGGGGGPWKPCE